MSDHVHTGILIDSRPPWSLMFAKEVDQDLDFDEGLEDDELYQRKPPRRRPLLWILMLLLVVGVVYWALGPESSLLTTQAPPTEPMAPAPIESPETGPRGVKPFPAPAVPIPVFREGQEVQLVQKAGQNTLSATLLNDASGRKPGPSVRMKETLIVLDGEMIGRDWVYKVRTQSGETGWVLEKSLKNKSSS